MADNLAPVPKCLRPEEADPNLNQGYSYFGLFRADNKLIQLWAREQLKRSFKAKFYHTVPDVDSVLLYNQGPPILLRSRGGGGVFMLACVHMHMCVSKRGKK